MYVACFAVGAYPSAERTYKPFNPILGETFELQKGEMRYIAEQVRLAEPTPRPLAARSPPRAVPGRRGAGEPPSAGGRGPCHGQGLGV